MRSCSEAALIIRSQHLPGDGTDYNVMIEATDAIGKLDGQGIPTVKPWDPDTIREKMELVRKSGAFAEAMDIDAAGLSFPPESESALREASQWKSLRESCRWRGIPFILKGVMTPKGALKAGESGGTGHCCVKPRRKGAGSVSVDSGSTSVNCKSCQGIGQSDEDLRGRRYPYRCRMYSKRLHSVQMPS